MFTCNPLCQVPYQLPLSPGAPHVQIRKLRFRDGNWLEQVHREKGSGKDWKKPSLTWEPVL